MMRKTLIAVLFASALPTFAMAMPDEGHRQHDGKHAPFEQLNLTQEQKLKMRELMGAQMKNRREITQRYLDKLPEAERKSMRDELKSSKENTHQQMRSLLKPEQQKQFDEMHEKMKAKRAQKS